MSHLNFLNKSIQFSRRVLISETATKTYSIYKHKLKTQTFKFKAIIKYRKQVTEKFSTQKHPFLKNNFKLSNLNYVILVFEILTHLKPENCRSFRTEIVQVSQLSSITNLFLHDLKPDMSGIETLTDFKF